MAKDVQEYPHLACFSALHAEEIFQDPIFADKDWFEHKSWKRHFIAGPWLILQIAAWYWPPVLFSCCIAVGVGIYHVYAEPAGAPNVTRRNLTTPFTLTSFALALLLVFRTNSAYGRWWEARTLLGGLLAITRTLARQTLAWADYRDAADIALAHSVVRWTILLPYALAQHLIHPPDWPASVQDLLSPEELQWLCAQSHLPATVSHVISAKLQALASSRATPFKQLASEEQLTLYNQSVAACERLSRQPIPIAYTRHTCRFMLTWLMFLPWALWNDCQWLTIPVAAIVTFLLVGIENIGIQIEQPFAVLPVLSFCTTIRANLSAMLEQGDSVRHIALVPQLAQKGQQ